MVIHFIDTYLLQIKLQIAPYTFFSQLGTTGVVKNIAKYLYTTVLARLKSEKNA